MEVAIANICAFDYNYELLGCIGGGMNILGATDIRYVDMNRSQLLTI